VRSNGARFDPPVLGAPTFDPRVLKLGERDLAAGANGAALAAGSPPPLYFGSVTEAVSAGG
jgi:hypothetical protein